MERFLLEQRSTFQRTTGGTIRILPQSRSARYVPTTITGRFTVQRPTFNDCTQQPPEQLHNRTSYRHISNVQLTRKRAAKQETRVVPPREANAG